MSLIVSRMPPPWEVKAAAVACGCILDTIKDMKEKAEGTLSDARSEEMKSQHAFEMLKSSLEQELKTMKKRMSAATAEKSGTEKTMSDASEELATTEKTLAAD